MNEFGKNYLKQVFLSEKASKIGKKLKLKIETVKLRIKMNSIEIRKINREKTIKQTSDSQRKKQPFDSSKCPSRQLKNKREKRRLPT